MGAQPNIDLILPTDVADAVAGYFEIYGAETHHLRPEVGGENIDISAHKRKAEHVDVQDPFGTAWGGIRRLLECGRLAQYARLGRSAPRRPPVEESTMREIHEGAHGAGIELTYRGKAFPGESVAPGSEVIREARFLNLPICVSRANSQWEMGGGGGWNPLFLRLYRGFGALQFLPDFPRNRRFSGIAPRRPQSNSPPDPPGAGIHSMFRNANFEENMRWAGRRQFGVFID